LLFATHPTAEGPLDRNAFWIKKKTFLSFFSNHWRQQNKITKIAQLLKASIQVLVSRRLGPLRHLIRVMRRHDLTQKDNSKDKNKFCFY